MKSLLIGKVRKLAAVWFVSAMAAAAVATCVYAHSPAPVVFDSPAEDDRGIMVLGNGEVGATAWLGADGVLHTVLQNSDSWNEGGRHVKTGATASTPRSEPSGSLIVRKQLEIN